MSTITTRSGKGSPLTNNEVDTNFTNLNTDKLESADLAGYATLSGATFTGEVEATGFNGDLTGAILFKGQAGEALTKGDPVYISGISGNKTVVSKADANDANKMPCFGIVDATVSANADCSVVTFGTLQGLDTSSFSEGDELFVSDTGTLTTTAPTGESSQIQKIGKVTRSHASAGSIKVVGAGRTNAVPNLNDGQFFLGNGSNQAVSTDFTTSVLGEISAGTGIGISGSGVISNSAPDQTVSLTGAGATSVSLAHIPNFTITSADNNTTYTAGTGLSLTGTVFANTAPDQTVTLTGAGTTTVSGTYPNFTITGAGTTYTAGTGITLTDTEFSLTDTNDKLNLTGGTLTGAVEIQQNGDALNLRSTTNAQPVRLTFSSDVPDAQIGHVEYTHSDTASYGSNEALTLGGTEASMTVLADGKLMFKDGIYEKPSSGTGAGTRKDDDWDTAYTYSQVGHLPLSGGSLTGTAYIHTGAGSTALVLKSTENWSSGVLNGGGLRWQEADGSSIAGIRGYVDGNGNNNLALGTGWLDQEVTITSSGMSVAGTITSGGNTVWTSGNDGSGSGLDADTVDGVQASGFLKTDGSNTGTFIDLYRDVDSGFGAYIDFREGSVQDIRLGVNVFDGELPEAGTALVLDRVGSGGGDGHLVVHGEIFAGHGGTPANGKKVWHSGNDGSGSGLDADTVDGLQANKFRGSKNYTYVNGGGSLYNSGSAGWTKVASVTVTNNCSGSVIYGTMYDRAYDDAEQYAISAVIRADCSFTSNNELHYVEIGCTAIASGTETNYRNKIRAVLTGSSTNSRTYELQFYETPWNDNHWELWSSGWTIFDTPQTIGTAVGTSYVNYTSKMNADILYANTSMSAPIYYDASNTGYYVDPAGTSRFDIFKPDIITCQNNGNQGTPRWDFRAYVVESDHIYAKSSSNNLYIGESGNPVQIRGTPRAPIYYDYNNTARYVNPNGESVLTTALMVGTATSNDAGANIVCRGSNAATSGYQPQNWHLVFQSSGGSAKGRITSSWYSTQYTTTSDYRLKEDVKEIPDAAEKLKQLKPCNFKWVEGEDRSDGFIAHELQEIIPEAVTGNKDDLDEEGNPEYQGIDQSKIVPILVKTVQDLLKKVEDQEARIVALENS